MEIKIVGNGVFGSFLKEELKYVATISDSDDVDVIILAVPISSYAVVAEKYKGKHLVNVCSVQESTNKICGTHSDRVTGIHPLFGPKSPKEGRSCIITKTCIESEDIIKLFQAISDRMLRHINGIGMSGKIHDEIMRKTHLPVLAFGELASLIVEQVIDIPDCYLPTSFKKLKELSIQMKDMGPGTVESIRSNF